MTRGSFLKKRGGVIASNANPADKGYLVKYPDGYVSWCPKVVFERQGFPLEDGTKITRQDIRDFVKLGYNAVSTIKSRGGKPVTLVEREYPTGFTAFETASCVDPKNYSQHIGADICADRLDSELWSHLGFMLQWANFGLSDVGAKYAKDDAAAAKRKAR